MRVVNQYEKVIPDTLNAHLSRFTQKLLDRTRETRYLLTKRRDEGTAGPRDGSARRPLTRRTMNDVADGLLLDVREISITDLEFADEESALNQALRRVLTSNADCNFNSFNSCI
jgi:hypothetical protein